MHVFFFFFFFFFVSFHMFRPVRSWLVWRFFSLCFLVIVYSFSVFRDFRSKDPRFDPRPGPGVFLIARDKWHPRLDAIYHELLKNLHAPAKDRARDLST